MTCGSKCTCKKEEWNNGTIYRIFVQREKNATSSIIDVPVDIAQSELTGKVFIGVENYCLDRRVTPDDETNYPLTNFNAQSADRREKWASVQYLQLQSINLPPDIDFTAMEDTQTGRNTHIFARIPLQTMFSGNTNNNYMFPRSAETFPLTKDGILYEMTNNPHALSNGRLRIQLLGDDNGPWNFTDHPIYNLAFTIVIYKPRNTYN